MSAINTKRKITRPAKQLAEKTAEVAVSNFMDGVSFVPTPVTQLRMMAASCFFGEPQYYREGTTNERPLRHLSFLAHLETCLGSIDPGMNSGETSAAARLESVIDRALDFDAEATLKVAVDLRQNERMRATPQVILVRAAMHPIVRGTHLIRQYAPGIIQRGDEPAVGLAYYLSKTDGAKKVPNSLKRAWADYLESQSEYVLAKYRMESKAVKTVDVVNLTHAYSPAINKLMKGQLTMTDRSWEAIVSKGKGTPEAWQEALPLLLNPKGHMALLRNLRNLDAAGLMSSDVLTALKSGVAGGKQFPFRYYSAYTAVAAAAKVGMLQDALSECIDLACANLPKFTGRVMSLCDNSGSAQGALTSEMGTMRVSTIGNLMGVITGKQADEGFVGVFGDTLKVEPVRKTDSTLTQLEKMATLGDTVGGSTENGIWLFFDKAIRQREHWDHIFVYSDMQAGHGGLYGVNPSEYAKYRWGDGRYIDVPALVAKYRKTVNPNVMVYMVQVAGYENSLMPEFYDRTFILGGWSENVLRFAGAMSEVYAAK